MTTHLFSLSACLESATTVGTLADMQRCLKKRYNSQDTGSNKHNLEDENYSLEILYMNIRPAQKVIDQNTWWLAQYNRHNWLEEGFSSAAISSTRNSAQNSAAFLYISCKWFLRMSKLIN